MPEKKLTLNRFPLFGLFAFRAAKKMGYPEQDARLLGYSTALLYAIYKAKAQAKKEKPEKEAKPPKEIEAKTKTLQFGGQDFQVIYGKGMAAGGHRTNAVCLILVSKQRTPLTLRPT